MEDQFGSDFITITDEDGKEFELEVLSTIEYNGQSYMAVTLAADDESDADLSVNIFRSADEDGEPVLYTIEDAEELETVYSLIMDQLYEEDDA